MKSINPYTNELLFEHHEDSAEKIHQVIEKSHQAFLSWRKTGFEERAKKIMKVAQFIEKEKNEFAKIMTLEMGKPISQSISEIEKCAWVCEYYAENAEKFLEPKSIETDAQKSYIRYDALGVILGIMPWNYPFWQVFRFAIPTLMAGNTVLLKHASNVMQSSKNIAKAFEYAGLGEIFQALIISSEKIEKIIKNPRIKGVSLTGSKPAGSAIAKIAGEEIKPSLLELGGSNALVVFEDCNWDSTLETIVNARFQNTGQSCIAGKRLLIEESIFDSFLKALKIKIENLKSGDPLNSETYIGTLAREDLAEDLEKQMKKSVEMGAEILIGGKRNAAYFEPTLLTNVTTEMPVFQEETFGPLLIAVPFKNENEAIDLVNASNFGLGCSLFTQNLDRAERMISELNEGAVFINELVKSDPRLPFGGVGISGYGRELSEDGILSFVNKKTVFLKA
ncbi:Succinate-semialdehyde dehydrogenase [NADP(+)] 1 [Candidatus Ornithobacterium hominis]|uniref:Succinate-semialdehyde dehydrogenase [NADP(+)] 1 n=1 Tax=Candidatus Ornithobacterium hominis TaxID=2497989 RepID=A0A383U3X2_9FLAO|nr:NAD-dependent succinate-semialdehyde dehydrogenase [Candidatus Ornithobacterium hominis]MCT7904570.1 NAD-dependent succinate-semialdehyde dehydrogenase [Candidatus Ornithobacterium hominis]SZD74089.1 Succinate-semialdehyde dehydrogenase [NADP(+)] 1 [Candidatus Ornithobacterium hominis]